MWYLSPEKTKQKLKSLADLDNCDINHHSVQMGKTRPQTLHKLLEDMRINDKDNALLEKVEQVSMLLAEFMLENHESADDLIWIIRDLLGHSPDFFSSIPLNKQQIKLISNRIQRHRHVYYPYVILARYVPAKQRKSMVKKVIDFADHPESLMPWVSTGEACETLGYLNAFPVASMHCLAQHLNDSGKNHIPATQILNVMPTFNNHALMAMDSLKSYLLLSIDGDDLDVLNYAQLSKIVTSTQFAHTLKPIFEQVMDKWDVIKQISNPELDGEYKNNMLSFYGQLCYLARYQ